ncbi:MAG: DNA-directed RNA polymerase subunit alpha, partial [Erysipelotrichia bacterium]|nr:DNA-directed RNA polymerase subunit alpha [Erysipelotrichia bacterium]
MSTIPHPFKNLNFKVNLIDENTHYGKFVVEPLERGFGLTLGNALRRVLLSSLPGASVFAVEIEGARHEFSALPGVVEDVTTIVLNLKDLVLKIEDEDLEAKRIEVDIKGPMTLKAGDLDLPAFVKVINPELELLTLTDEGQLKMTIHIRNGRGYVTSESNKLERLH